MNVIANLDYCTATHDQNLYNLAASSSQKKTFQSSLLKDTIATSMQSKTPAALERSAAIATEGGCTRLLVYKATT